jgi:hypothetical protein
MSYLRSGIFLAPFHALGENPTLALERDMELLQHLDKLNYTPTPRKFAPGPLRIPLALTRCEA